MNDELCLHEQSVNSQNPPNKPTLVNSVNTVFSLAPMRGCPSFYARKQLFRPASPELQIPVETKCRRNKATKLQQGCSSLSPSPPPLSLLCLSCFGLPSRRYAESICSFSSRGKVCFTPRAPARARRRSHHLEVEAREGLGRARRGAGGRQRQRHLPPFHIVPFLLSISAAACLSLFPLIFVFRICIRC